MIRLVNVNRTSAGRLLEEAQSDSRGGFKLLVVAASAQVAICGNLDSSVRRVEGVEGQVLHLGIWIPVIIV